MVIGARLTLVESHNIAGHPISLAAKSKARPRKNVKMEWKGSRGEDVLSVSI